MDSIYKTFKSETHKLEIHHDLHCENPRSWQDSLGTFVMWHPRYNYGDENNPLEYSEYLQGLDEPYVIFNVYMYDHSGVTFSTSPFSCIWDSGQVGIIYATHMQIKEWFNELTEETIERAKMCLQTEIEELARYAEGMCYGYKLFELTKCEHCGVVKEEETDACWGYITGSPESIMVDNIPEEIRRKLQQVV